MNFTLLQNIPNGYFQKHFKRKTVDKKDTEINVAHKMSDEETQIQLFQNTMKILLTFGNILGLNPVSEMLNRDLSNKRYAQSLWKLTYFLLIIGSQSLVIFFCWYRLLVSPISIKTLGPVCYYSSSWCTTLIFYRISTRWYDVVKAVNNCNLNEYITSNITKTVKIICVVSSCAALFEYILTTLTRIAQVADCSAHENGIHEEYIRLAYPWLNILNIPTNIYTSIVIQLFNLVITLNWNYCLLFIFCTSLYLISIFKEINKNINVAANLDYIPPSKWVQLREDYTRATRLVRSFDEIFSGLILVSFASNLFLICLQLYNVLTNGLHLRQLLKLKCPNFPSGPLGGNEYTLYLVFSLTYLTSRFAIVSLVAANVNAYSMASVNALYRIPNNAYYKEVQRFVDQIHGDTIALSGLNFFYITRELILSIAATIVTYDLVVLQFRSHDLTET